MDRVTLKGRHFRNCQHFLSQLKGDPMEKNKFSKSSQCRKTESRALWDFPTSILTQNSKINEGGPFREKHFSEKRSRSAEKNEKGDPSVSPGMVCYVENQEKPFWFSSLGQTVQFGAMIFSRTLMNFCGQFVWNEKKPL